jgi:hypothetical protein
MEYGGSDLAREWRERVDKRFDKLDEQGEAMTASLAKTASILTGMETRLSALEKQPGQVATAISQFSNLGGCLYMALMVAVTGAGIFVSAVIGIGAAIIIR